MRLLVLAAAAAIAAPVGRVAAQEDQPIEFEAGPATFTFSGQVNQAILFYDDGVESETYGPVDNDNSSSRIALEFEAGLSDALTLGGAFELEYQPYASDVVNLETRGDPDFDFREDDLRKLEVFLETDFGTLWLGQGDMASNESAEVDLSGTTVAANSDVEDTAGGQIFRLAGGGLSEVRVDDAFDNLDGLSRLVRVRYDTPSLLDDRLTLSASYGQDLIADDDADQYDVAALFESETDALTVGAAAAYAWEGEDTTILSGSASVLHGATGISATVAAGREDDGEVQGRYGYVKLGLEADLLEGVGPTDLSLDYFESADLGAEGASATSAGVTVVQTIDRIGAEVYASVRSLDHEDDVGDYEAGTAVLIGARVRF